MVFPAERMRNASTRSCSLSTSGTGSATVRHAGIPTVRYTAREKMYAAVAQEKIPYLVSFRDSGTNEQGKWTRGVGIYTLVYAGNGVAPTVREGEQNRRLHEYEGGRCWYCEKFSKETHLEKNHRRTWHCHPMCAACPRGQRVPAI